MDALPAQELPPGWAWTSIGALGAVYGGLTKNPKRTSATDQLPYLRVANVLAGRLNMAEVKRIGVFPDEVARGSLQADDLLIVEGNGSADQIGRCALWSGAIAPCFHQNHLIRVRMPEPALAKWTLYWLLSSRGRASIEAVASSTSGLHTLSISKIVQLAVPVAPLGECERVVTAIEDAFEEVEAGEAALARAREGLTQFRASLLHAACTGALSGDGGDGWQTKPLAELISEGPKNGYSPKAGDNDSGTLSLKLTATTSGRLNLAPHAVKRLSETVPRGSPLYLRSGDLLFQRGNTPEYVGIAAIYDGPPETYVYPDLMIRVRTPDPALTGWIWRVANAPAGRRHMRNAASGTAGSMPKITGDAVRSLPIPLPPHEEMLRLLGRIEEELNAADEAEALLNAQQAAAVMLRQSILHAAFTGRLVPQDPADEPAATLLARLRATPVALRRPRARRTATQPDLIETPA